MGKTKYIDADKLADELSRVPWYEREDEKQAIRMVKEFPAADVVEVVRCKDCKHRPIATRADEGILWGFSVEFPDERCPLQCEDGWYNHYPKDDFYCANAERRTDE